MKQAVDDWWELAKGAERAANHPQWSKTYQMGLCLSKMISASFILFHTEINDILDPFLAKLAIYEKYDVEFPQIFCYK